MRLPLGFDDVILQGFFLLVQFVQVFDCPFLELFGNGDPRKTLLDLILQFLPGDTSLLADRSPAFGAMVIGVIEKERCGHFFNRCFATWAAITVPVGKFEFAIAAHDLVLFLGCHHPRIRRLGPQIVKLAKAKKVNVKLFSREQVMKVLIPDGKRTKHALAEIVAGQFPEQLGSKLPPKRKAWMREHYQMGIFDAVGLVFAFRKCHMESE